MASNLTSSLVIFCRTIDEICSSVASSAASQSSHRTTTAASRAANDPPLSTSESAPLSARSLESMTGASPSPQEALNLALNRSTTPSFSSTLSGDHRPQDAQRKHSWPPDAYPASRWYVSHTTSAGATGTSLFKSEEMPVSYRDRSECCNSGIITISHSSNIMLYL